MEEIRNQRVYMVSLGCAKNRVDSEKALALLLKQGCRVTDDPGEAECILINSCGFINSARRETVDTILELAEYKKQNPSLNLAVMGCMVELFRKEMADEMPEINYFLGLSDKSVSNVYRSDNIERVIQPGSVFAYLKIAEGCGNSCTFCSIPLIRGPLKSRPMEDIAMEARSLLGRGVKELCLVAQDTTRYGADLGMKNGLVKLIRRILEEKPVWVRILYAYPTLLTDELIDLIGSEPSICKYIDVPFQHIHNGILKRMGRQESEYDILRLLEKLRKTMPEGAVRSSFIVGFPGETEREFGRLERFLEEALLDHVGIFVYSREEGTKAAFMEDDVPPKVKEERRERLMEVQRKISSAINARKVGSVLPVMVERYSGEERLLTGRLSTQAPEVDGEVILDNCEALPGEIIDIRIKEGLDYDLVGEPV